MSKRQSLEALQQMRRDGMVILSGASNPFQGTCYLCEKRIPAGEGRIWKVRVLRGTHLLCASCDARVREPAAEGGGE